MTNAVCEPTLNLTIASVGPEQRAQPAHGELVRDQVAQLLRHLTPLVRERNVALDLASVGRIDASGIAALATLYSSARAAGNSFRVTNPSARVAEVLSVVGLDCILLSHHVVRNSQCGGNMDRSAA
jgi:anti-anti-sigma factor